MMESAILPAATVTLLLTLHAMNWSCTTSANTGSISATAAATASGEAFGVDVACTMGRRLPMYWELKRVEEASSTDLADTEMCLSSAGGAGGGAAIMPPAAGLGGGEAAAGRLVPVVVVVVARPSSSARRRACSETLRPVRSTSNVLAAVWMTCIMGRPDSIPPTLAMAATSSGSSISLGSTDASTVGGGEGSAAAAVPPPDPCSWVRKVAAFSKKAFWRPMISVGVRYDAAPVPPSASATSRDSGRSL
mmetsp:Transcript_30714/g.89226  ORF Transcript_30714/g.89226 Transcript_30714/m.89226 type:complete len:249 (+) Transcript_30714:581-1327(+)